MVQVRPNRNLKLKNMKTHLIRAIFAFVFTFSISLSACFAGGIQQDLNKVIGACAVSDGVTSIDIPMMLVKINASISNDDTEVELLIEKIDKLNILVFGDSEAGKQSFKMYKNDLGLFSQTHKIETFLAEKEGDNTVQLKSVSENGLITNLLMEVDGDEHLLIHLKGEFTQKDLQHLTKIMKQSKP